MIDEPVFESKALLQDFMSMLMRHSNAVSRTLQSGDVYLPLLLEAENGMAHANDWANGFLRGMEMRRDGWLPLMEDEEQAGSLIPIFALAHEHDPDPELRSYKEPISAEMRERLIRPNQESIDRIFDLGCDFAADQKQHQHRNQCHAKKCGEEHRKGLCECERLKEPAFLGSEREHRNETDRNDEKREEERPADTLGGIDDDFHALCIGRVAAFLFTKVL